MASREQEKVRVKVSYDPDLSRIGSIIELPRPQAAAMVGEGCAQYVDEAGEVMETDRGTRYAGPVTGRPVLTPPAGQPAPGSPAEAPPSPDAPSQMRARGGNGNDK